jgi:hypothetical protein
MRAELALVSYWIVAKTVRVDVHVSLSSLKCVV